MKPQQLRDFLKGKKTYITAAIGILGAVAAWSDGQINGLGTGGRDARQTHGRDAHATGCRPCHTVVMPHHVTHATLQLHFRQRQVVGRGHGRVGDLAFDHVHAAGQA